MPFYFWPTNIDIISALFAFFLLFGIVWYTWRHRGLPGAAPLISLMVAGGIWVVSFLLEMLSDSLESKLFWENTQFFCLSIIALLYFAFIIIFTGRHKVMTSKYWLLLSIEPVLSQIIIWTNNLHHWFRISAQIETFGLSFPGVLLNHYGWWFWFNAVYLLAFFLLDLVLLFISYFQTPHWSRNKLWFLILGVFIPWLANITTVPIWAVNQQNYLMIVSVAISLLIMAWGLLRTRILDILPIAREAILDQMSEAVIVIDSLGRVVELNQTARRHPSVKPGLWVGNSLTKLIPELSEIQFGDQFTTTFEKEVCLQADGKKLNFDLHISPLYDENKVVAGWLAIFHDISRQKNEELRLREAEGLTHKALNESRRHTEELSILRKINESLNQATTLRAALIPALKAILEISNGEQIWLLLLEKGTTSHRLIKYSPEDPSSPLQFTNGLPNKNPCIHELLNGKIVKPMNFARCNCSQDSNQLHPKHKQHFSFLLQSGKEPLGLINIVIKNNASLDVDSIHLIETLSDSLGVAIERVRLFKSEHNQRRLAETIQDIGATLTASLDLNDVLDLLLQEISRLVPYDAGNVMLFDQDQARITRSKGYEILGEQVSEAIAKLSFSTQTTSNIRRIISTKKVYIIEDTHLEKDWLPTIGSSHFHSWMGAPVIVNGQVKAIFALDKAEPGFFTQNHADQMNSFCSEAALAIQNAFLYKAGLKRIKELESLQATLNDITSELDLNQLLNDIIERSVSLLDSTIGILGLYDRVSQEFKIVVSVNAISNLTGSVIPMGKGVMGQVALTRKPVVIDDYSTWEDRIDEYTTDFPHAVLQVPLLAGEELLGVIGVGNSDAQKTYNEEDIRLLTMFAQQATVAIHNAQLYTDAKQRAEESETLRKAGSIVASTLQQKQVLRLILEQLTAVVPCDSATILLFKKGALEIVDGQGFKDRSPLLGLRIPLTKDQPGASVFTEKKSLIIGDIPQEFPSFNKAAKLHVQSWIGVPLIFQGRSIGILSLDSMKKNNFNQNHARLANAFANQVAIALENVRLYEEAILSAKRLATLYRMSQKISVNLHVEEVYRAIHKATVDLMASDTFILSVYDNEKQMIKDVYFVDHGIPQTLAIRPLGQGLFSRAILEKKTIMYNRFDEALAKKTQAILLGDEKDDSLVKSLIIVPLRIGKEIKRILSTQSYTADAYTDQDTEALELLAAHAAIALENAQLFSEIQELAITDPLTKIFNRRHFFDMAEQDFDRSKRYHRPMSMIMMDIDHFKRVNDTYGHGVGDQVLQKIAAIYNHTLREVDIFARYGGEEFVVLLPETTATEAQLIAERLRQLIARTPIEITNQTLSLTISFGVVELDADCRNIEELIDRSDQALYQSKHNGRNRVSVWSPSLQSTPTNNLHPHS